MAHRSGRELLNRCAGVLFAVVVVVGYLVTSREQPVRFDEDPVLEPGKSDDLAADLRRMWRTVPGREFPVSPVSAINAAGRVFATVDLVGLTTNQLFAAVGHHRTSSNSGYRAPFFPVKEGTLVYRFDCGQFGWQFNVGVDARGIVTGVETLWIH